jgi:hypothetical protein
VSDPNAPAEHAVMPQEEAAAWFLDECRHADGRWHNEVWMPSQAALADFDPAAAIPRMHGATLLVVASADLNAPTADALAAFELAPEPKELVMVEGHHFTPYRGDSFVQSSTAAGDFFQRWLS